MTGALSMSTEGRYGEAWAVAARLARQMYAGWTPAAREDLVQVTLERLWRHFDRRGWPENLEAFLRVALRRNAVNLHEHEVRRPAVAAGLSSTVEALGTADVAGWLNELRRTPSALALQRLTVERVLGLLADRETRLLEMRYVDNRPVRSIAEDLGMHPDAVSRALSRGIRRLRDALEAHPQVLEELLSAGATL